MFSKSYRPFLKVINCGFGQNINIQPDGRVYACSESKNELVGNVQRDSISTIRKHLHNLYMTTSVNNMSDCEQCDLRYICGGGCRIDNFSFTGTYLKPSKCKIDPDFKKSVYKVMADRRHWAWSK